MNNVKQARRKPCQCYLLQFKQQHERKTQMAKMKEYLEIIAAECDECGGAGLVFFGNEKDFDVQPCDCIADINDDLTLDWVNE